MFVCVCVSLCVCVCVLIADPAMRPSPPLRSEQCKLDLLMNVFSHHIQVQSKYAIYAHLASPFTAPVCQAFRLNENIHRHNHVRHPLLTSCRNTARHGCYAEGNLENLRAQTGELFSRSVRCYRTDHRVSERRFRPTVS